MKPIPDDTWTWKICRAVLMTYGIKDPEAGKHIGKWLRQCKGDHKELERIMREAATQERGDIVSYINGCMPKNGKKVDEAAIRAMKLATARMVMRTKQRFLSSEEERIIMQYGTDEDRLSFGIEENVG